MQGLSTRESSGPTLPQDAEPWLCGCPVLLRAAADEAPLLPSLIIAPSEGDSPEAVPSGVLPPALELGDAPSTQWGLIPSPRPLQFPLLAPDPWDLLWDKVRTVVSFPTQCRGASPGVLLGSPGVLLVITLCHHPE